VDWKNVLQIRGAGRKSQKPPSQVVGKKPNGKSQLQSKGNRFMKTSVVGRAFVVLALLAPFLTTAPGAHGAILISTLGQPVSLYVGALAGWRTANGFVTASNATTVTSAQLVVKNDDNVNHFFALEIWTDNDGQPYTLLGTFSNTPVALASVTTTLSFTNGTGISLSPKTQYWLTPHFLDANGNPAYSTFGAFATDAGSIFTLELFSKTWISTDGGLSWSRGVSAIFRYSLSDSSAVPQTPAFTDLKKVNGALQMTLSGLTTGDTVVLQVSTNLQNWVSVQTNVVNSSTLSLTNTINPAIPIQFFRAAKH
jgi:hypothetical protein